MLKRPVCDLETGVNWWPEESGKCINHLKHSGFQMGTFWSAQCHPGL